MIHGNIIHKVDITATGKASSLEGAYMEAVIKSDKMISAAISNDNPKNSTGLSISRDQWSHKAGGSIPNGSAFFVVEIKASVVFYGRN